MIFRLLRQRPSIVFNATRLMLALAGALHAQQAGEKVVRVEQAAQITDGVLISNVSVAGKTIESGLFIKPPAVIQPVTPFQAGSDWLQQMTVSLVNRTNKTIASGGIILHFLDTGDCHATPCVGVTLHFGQMPAVDAYDGRTGRPLRPEHPEAPPLGWKPEQTITIKVSDYMAEIEQQLANYIPVTDVTKVNVYRGAFYFEDGTRWTGGRFSVPDPEHPGKFTDLPANYFPGRRGHNWPPGYSN